MSELLPRIPKVKKKPKSNVKVVFKDAVNGDIIKHNNLRD